MERLVGVFTFETSEASFAADAPKAGRGLSCFHVVRRFGGDRTGLLERKLRPLLPDAA
jgi:hypothetical protein